MSTALVNLEATFKRKNTNGWVSIPNALIENQALLTHAELSFLLAVARRGDGCIITDQSWSKWTGLKARQKEYAITGLRDKGLMIEGRGNKAKYSIAWATWRKFVLHATPPEIIKPRTKGRGVKAAADMRVHEECAANGCQKLCDECDSNAQPVAQTGADERADMHRAAAGGELVDIGMRRGANAQPVARSLKGNHGSRRAIAQPVARSTDAYPLLFDAIRRRFPTVTAAFLLRLLDRVQASCKTVPSDRDLARLVGVATKRTQHSEGMYLETLPAVCGAWLIEKQVTAPKADGRISFDDVISQLKALADADRRFAKEVRNVCRALDETDWASLPKARFVEAIDQISKPFSAVCLQVYSESPEYFKQFESLTESASTLGLEEPQTNEHIRVHLEMSAYEFCKAPYIWPSSHPFSD